MNSVFRSATVRSLGLGLVLWAAAALLAAQEPHFMLLGEQILRARVSAIRPGGVVALVGDGRKLELRLADVRLPAAGSPFGAEAETLLEQRLLGRSVEARLRGSEAPGEPWRGYLVVGGGDIRLELVQRGLARHCPGSLREVPLEAAQQAARSARRGIWGQPQHDAGTGCERAVTGRKD